MCIFSSCLKALKHMHFIARGSHTKDCMTHATS